MKVEMGKKYRTRSGLSVRILCTDLQHPEYPVVVAVKEDDVEIMRRYTSDGRYLVNNCTCPSDMDLVEVLEK